MFFNLFIDLCGVGGELFVLGSLINDMFFY